MKNFNISDLPHGFGHFFSNFSTKYTLSFVAISLTLTLVGCGDIFAPKVASICKDDVKLCADLNTDEWCRAEKADIIKHRYRHPEDGNAEETYALMLMFEDYQRCITNASGLTHKKYRDKEADRMKGVLTARNELDRLKRKTRDNPDPLLSYYHWSRFGDESALERFMIAANSNRLDSPELQIALASMQAKKDTNLTKATLYRALSMYENDENINVSVFYTLSTIGIEQGNFKLAYIWSLVASHYGELINLQQLDAMATQHQLPVTLMDEVADEIIDALEDGAFDAEKLGLTGL